MSEKKMQIIIEVEEEGLSIDSKMDVLLTLNVLSNAVAIVSDDVIEKSMEMKEKFNAMLEEAEKAMEGEEEDENVIQ